MVKSHPQKFVELQPQSNNHHWGFLGLLPLPKCSIRPGGTAVCLPPVRGSRGLAPCRAKRPAISCGKRSLFHGQVPWDEWVMVSYGHPWESLWPDGFRRLGMTTPQRETMNSGPVLGEMAYSVQGIPHLLVWSTTSLVLFEPFKQIMEWKTCSSSSTQLPNAFLSTRCWNL